LTRPEGPRLWCWYSEAEGRSLVVVRQWTCLVSG